MAEHTHFTPLLEESSIVGEWVRGSICAARQRYRIAGYCHPSYRPVLEQLREDVAYDRVEDSQLCAYVRGEKVIDLMVRKHEIASAYTRASVQKVNSSGKNMESIVIARLVDQGLVSYETKVGAVWPEYACNGKENTTIAHVMRHEAGLPFLSYFPGGDIEPSELTTAAVKAGAVSAKIEKLTPETPPGEVRKYHTMSRGFLVNEIVRRVDPAGRTIGEIVAQDLAAPLGLSAELSVGLPPERAGEGVVMGSAKGAGHFCCVAYCCKGEVELCNEPPSKCLGVSAANPLAKPLSRALLACAAPVCAPLCAMQETFIDMMTDPVAGFENSSASVHASARAMAKVGAAIVGDVDGVRLLSPKGLAAGLANPVQKTMYLQPSPAMPPTESHHGPWGNMGFYQYGKDDGDGVLRPGERGGLYGWHGAGGSSFTVEPEKQVSIGFTVTFFNFLVMMNPMSRRLGVKVLECAEAAAGGATPAAMVRD